MHMRQDKRLEAAYEWLEKKWEDKSWEVKECEGNVNQKIERLYPSLLDEIRADLYPDIGLMNTDFDALERIVVGFLYRRFTNEQG